ncbi:MAG TPA: dihydrolipoamide acetyltransferase family protein [Conexibacter sp.]|nr:dihydrolipoamide acetyltransferase family protein [Conexibacter sp.]
MTDITMPKLSDSMEEGTILSWLKADGETIAVGEELVEIETDKATMTYEAPGAGTLAIIAAAGEALAVGAVIARVGIASADAASAEARAAAPAGPVESAPPARAHTRASSAPPAGSTAAANGAAPAVAATPIARRLAAAHGVELAALAGTGPRGRVTRADVAAAAGIAAPPAPAPAVPAARAPAPAPAASVSRADGVEIRELTRLQQVVARRMAEAKATVPEFQVQTEATMDAALALRATLKVAAAAGDVAPSVNDLVVKAAALALRAHPLANGSYKDGRFELHPRVNVGIAVAAQDALVVPTITDADARSLGSIAAEARRLAGRVRDGSITPPELSGGTFTVSNLGMYGMTAISPVINMPQAAILGVGATRTVLARDQDGEIVDRQLMTLTLTCDHRILYGADAAQFLATIRDLLETPLRLAL